MGRKTVSHDEFLIERLMKSFHCEDQENTILWFLFKDTSISHIPPPIPKPQCGPLPKDILYMKNEMNSSLFRRRFPQVLE